MFAIHGKNKIFRNRFSTEAEIGNKSLIEWEIMQKIRNELNGIHILSPTGGSNEIDSIKMLFDEKP